MTAASAYTEQELIDRFRNGEQQAFKWLFDQYYVSILYYATNLLERKSEAEDIVQDIYFKLWRRRAEFNSLLHVRSFLYKSTRFACIDHLRSASSRERHIELLINRAINDLKSDNLMIEEELYREIVAEINRLPEKYAIILRLKYLHNLDYAAIAGRLDMSEATVRKQKQRAIELLRTLVLKKQLLSLAVLTALLERIGF